MHRLVLLLLALIGFTSAANHPNCGTRGPVPPHLLGHRRIISGTDALGNDHHEFPWQCSLQFNYYPFKSNFSHVCGASLIADRWLLTAGHCLGTIASNYQVRCGSDYLERPEEGIIAAVDKIFHHPDFKLNQTDATLEYDFALIRLNNTLPVENASESLGTICLPDPREPLDRLAGARCLISGWGEAFRDHSHIPVLQKASFTILNQTQCIRKWGPEKIHSLIKPKTIKDWHLCAESPQAQRTICSGDSGGSLSCWLGGRWYTVGVASMGDFTELDKGFYCIESSKTPNIYARVSTASEWIWKTMAKHS